MRLTRCFVPPPLCAGEARLLPEQVSNHVARVLRARAGDALTLFDGRGGEFPATIERIDRHGVRVQVGAHQAIERESALRVTLLQALARSERMDLIVQKATELGVAAIVAWGGERSLLRLQGAALTRRREHWQSVAISACEQCGRNRVPAMSIEPDLAAVCAQSDSAGLRLLLSPHGQRALLSDPRLSMLPPDAAIALAVGPEGGFGDGELALAGQHGFEFCGLGPRVLRTETAALAALAALQAVAGDLRG
jgi:16S rRNA (uracil1498-N3)-methyltransferase